MAFTGIQGTIDFYIMQEGQLTNELTDIMMGITRASQDAAKLAQSVSSQREEVQATYEQGSTKYQSAMEDIQDDYQLKLAEITAWESQMETHKQEKETELQACTSYKNSFMSALKQNVSSSFKYAQGGGSGS